MFNRRDEGFDWVGLLAVIVAIGVYISLAMGNTP